jgi:hypothetical protein
MEVPALTPETVPEPVPMVAIPALLLDQAPPLVISFKVEDSPVQADKVPPIEAGKGFTVNVVVVKQPDASL